MIRDSEIPKCPEFEVKSKIEKIFKKHNSLEEYSLKIYEIDPYFYGHYEKKTQADKKRVQIYIIRIDIYFSECFLAVEIDEEGLTDETLFLKKKDKKH